MEGLNIATKIEFPIRITANENAEIVGQFYASIGRDLDSISIQLYITNKELVEANMDIVRNAYNEFYSSVIKESVLVGYQFMEENKSETPIIENPIEEPILDK